MISTRSVNVDVNTRAKGHWKKAAREGSVILRFERPISTKRRLQKGIEELRGVYMLEYV